MKKMKAILLWCSMLILTVLVGIYTYSFFTPLKLNEKKESISIYDINGDLMYESNYKKNMKWIYIDDVPKNVQDAFVSVEDKRFYQHFGIDPIRIGKALFNNATSDNAILEGGSTITQQYAKNLFLSNDQTYSRKVSEFFYSTRLEMQYSKEEILEGYLNTLYFGHGVYGISNASEYFYNKQMSELSNAELAMLVGIPNGPSIFSPYISMENALNRQAIILEVLLNNDVLSEEEYQIARNETLSFISHDNDMMYGYDEYYISSVIDTLQQMERDGEIDLSRELHIYTYYDPEVQKSLQQSIYNNVSLENELEISGVVMQPFTGNILAISGGKDYTISQYNRALYSKRQVASTIKPLLYYSALVQGFTPSSTFISQPTTFTLADGKEYAPTNSNEKYPYKEISMINAVSLSDNIYAVKTHLFLGMDTLNNSLRSFGINETATASEALGTVNMSITEITTIYNTFASEGLYVKPAFIRQINDADNQALYTREVDLKRLMNRDETLILNQMLRAPFDNKNISYTYPTLYGHEPNPTVGAKSGTSDWDSLVVGFTPEYTIGVWSGFDDNRFLEKEYYPYAKSVWRDTFNALYENRESFWYQPSDQIIVKKVNPITGKEASDGSTYWFKKE